MALTYTPQTTETPNSTTVATADDDDALKKRLLSRIAVAGVVIVGLLGGLAVYDSLNKPQGPAMPKMAATPASPTLPINPDEAVEPAATTLTETKVGEPDLADAEQRTEEKKTVQVEPATIPERTDTPRALVSAEKPLKAAKSVTPPATARSAAVRPSPPVAAPQKPDAQREITRVMPERDAPGIAKAGAPASRPLTQAGETARRFLVQVGVFSNHANAEELVARLHQAGIPAQVESRVQVGPFATRAEVDAARAKLKSLGLDEGMLVRR
jgi:DedD protein